MRLRSAAAVTLACAVPAQSPELDAGRNALAAGRRAEAVEHARAALEREPRSGAALALALEATAGDADARALWSREVASRLADAGGKLDLDRALRSAVGAEHEPAAALAIARASAADELARFASAARKSIDAASEAALVADWACALGREIAGGAIAVADAHRADFPPQFPLVGSAAQREVVRALEAELVSALAAERWGDAIELARVLRGLAAQATFEDLEGPAAPDLSETGRRAGDALLRARRALAASLGEPATVESLAEHDGDRCDAFTREHASEAAPAVAVSPRGWYRVETICGHATLAGVTETIELHHERLARWYGRDPFVDRPGLVRVAPEASDLESEGTPFWWAGGFQSGDVTTMRFACGSIEGLGHGLTHELTHRFDGALYPGIPAWLAEGKAVWTGAAYGRAQDEGFVANHALFGTLDDAAFRGYGARENLEKLIAGGIEDYRDNYVAGYALYVFLATWGDEVAPPRYAEALRRFQETRRTDKRDALAAFAAHFADGEDGRPEDMEAFTAEFSAWLAGFHWRDRKPWTARYTESLPGGGGELVLDEPTWVWSRNRAEPWFGQDHARAAGELLVRFGRRDAALQAYVWSLGVDERSEEVERALLDLAERGDRDDVAWTLRHALARRGHEEAMRPAPMLARLPRTRALLEHYRKAAEACAQRGCALAAAALAADHDRIAAHVGAPRIAVELSQPDLARIEERTLPFDRPAASLLGEGWVEDRLTDYERHRVAGLWCADERGSLWLGRSDPRRGTGTLDRGAALHHVFVRSREWIAPGRYRVRARIRPASTYFAGSLVLGVRRRDRNVRLDLSGGDWLYSIGEKEATTDLEAVAYHLHGLFERDYALGPSTRGGEVAFGRSLSAFDVEIAVDGGAVHAFVDGKHAATYHTPDGAPVEGYIGFAVSSGEYEVARCSVERLDRSAAHAPLAGVPPPIVLGAPRAVEFRRALNRRWVGIPAARTGSLVLWLPLEVRADDGAVDAERAIERAVERARDFETVLARRGLAIAVHLALPAALGEATIARAKEAIAREAPDIAPRLSIVAHGPQGLSDALAARERYGTTDDHQAWLCFVDSAGVLRGAQPFYVGTALDLSLARWIDVFRNR